MSIQYSDFVTNGLVCSYASDRFLLNDFKGYYNKSEIVLFDPSLVEYYIDFAKEQGNGVIKVRNVTHQQYQDFLKLKLEHTKVSLHSPVYIFTPEFFKLEGHKYKKIRQAENKYKNGIPNLDNPDEIIPIQILTKPKQQEDVLNLIALWKKQRKDAHFQFFIGYEKNYYKKYFNFVSKHNCLYFYANDQLIGYNILENIDNTKFNLLFGKVDMRYGLFYNYMDITTYKYIFNNITKGETFYVNSGDTGGDQTMLNFKTKLYDVYDVNPIYNITVNLNKKINKII